MIIERLAQAGDVAMAENAEAAAAQAHFLAVDFDELVGQVADDGLRCRQPNGLVSS
jgi:hypothetical protein